MTIFLVAEIGVNWDGDFELVSEMMRQSKESGFDAVKFQAYEEKVVKNHPQRNRLLKSTISSSNVEKIHDIAKSVGIEWFCTPMYLGAVDILEPFVSRYKIREMDGRPIIENRQSELLDRLLKTEKEIMISSQVSPKNSRYFNHSHIRWLYCVPKYPCDLSDIDFRFITEFDGFSNHCKKLSAPLCAAILGAKIIEVHITSSKSSDFVDNNVSFDYSEIKELARLVRDSEKIKK